MFVCCYCFDADAYQSWCRCLPGTLHSTVDTTNERSCKKGDIDLGLQEHFPSTASEINYSYVMFILRRLSY
jgi:hypothetical protein